MKTRKIQTKMWRDEWFAGLSRASKLLFIYMISNEFVGLSGYLELPDRQICFDTGLTSQELENCKDELKGKVNFHNGWVFVVNLIKHDPIKGKDNNLWKPYEKELESVPQDIKEALDPVQKKIEDDITPLKGASSPFKGGKGIGKGTGKGNKGVVKGETEKIKHLAAQVQTEPRSGAIFRQQLAALTDDVLEDIAMRYQLPISFVRSKKDDVENWVEEKPSRARGRNLKRTLMAWVKRDAITIKKEASNAKKRISFIDPA